VSSRRAFLWFWTGGLALFAFVIALGLPLVLTEVPGGILDHQAAGSAANVDRIQAAWRKAGLLDQAAIAMAADLVFIGVYGIGCLLGGLYLRGAGMAWLRAPGLIAMVSGAGFLLTDYAETISQFVQLTRFRGDDALAQLAAVVRPVKVACWIIATLAILFALIAEWRGRRSA
jgi:hypothetical protein